MKINIGFSNNKNLFNYPFDKKYSLKTCFGINTPILMADGTTKMIEDIKIGDWVMSFEGLDQLKPGRVIRTFSHEINDLYDLDGLKVTANHPFLTLPYSIASNIGEMNNEKIINDNTDKLYEKKTTPKKPHKVWLDFFPNRSKKNSSLRNSNHSSTVSMTTGYQQVRVNSQIPAFMDVSNDDMQPFPMSPGIVNNTLPVQTTNQFQLSYQPLGMIDKTYCLVKANGLMVKPPSLKLLTGNHLVYNFTVEGWHTYIAGGYRVHNK
ncbi:MAG: hypothetical protein K1X44_02655 [Alphaproteobacteria bacterium]|nr:hypothetical protein [Alphaproteobacteria bacterium]